ncbi:MAG: hypothetical protein ACFFC7_05240 [Candidatus Hermodarchaeota archaeon]
MFSLSQMEKEIQQILKDSESRNWYKGFIEELSSSMEMYIHLSGPLPEEEPEVTTLPFNMAIQWAQRDWEALKLPKPWTVVWVARGGFILLDYVEKIINDSIWTYIKPVSPTHEDPSVFEQYSDPDFEAKIAEYENKTTSLIFIEDIVDSGENLEIVSEFTIEKCEELEIEIVDRATLCLLTRMQSLGNMKIYGVFTSYEGGISERSWGNNRPDGFDYYDFREQREYIQEWIP